MNRQNSKHLHYWSLTISFDVKFCSEYKENEKKYGQLESIEWMLLWCRGGGKTISYNLKTLVKESNVLIIFFTISLPLQKRIPWLSSKVSFGHFVWIIKVFIGLWAFECKIGKPPINLSNTEFWTVWVSLLTKNTKFVLNNICTY